VKLLKNVIPHLAVLISFGIYLRYWAEVARQCPNFCNRGYDDFAYHADFIGLLNGSWPGDTAFYQSPLPGFFLGVVYAVFQYPVKNLAIPYLVQIFLLTLTGALSYKIASSLFSKYIGVTTILLLSFYEFTKFYATTIEANILLTFFLTATLYCLFNYRSHQNKGYLFLASICLGLAALGRTNNLAILGAVIGWFILLKVPLKDLLINIALLCLLTLLVILPAIFHSSLNAGKFVLVTYTGAYNFTMGNLPGAPGTYWDQATASLEPSLEFITQHPLDWLLLTLRKLRLFFTFPWSPAQFNELPF
jgi:4-amino-4-deoxy-L-arabinose transferase-like glycosyltransferase